MRKRHSITSRREKRKVMTYQIIYKALDTNEVVDIDRTHYSSQKAAHDVAWRECYSASTQEVPVYLSFDIQELLLEEDEE